MTQKDERWANRLTLDEWLELERLARKAGLALERLHHKLNEHVLDRERFPDLKHHMVETLVRAGNLVHEAHQTFFPHNYWVQEEWTGGDSGNPRNFTLREPNWVTISWTFPKEQVDKYRDENGEIKIPQRRGRDILFPVSKDELAPCDRCDVSYVTSVNEGPTAVTISVEADSSIREDYADVIAEAINDQVTRRQASGQVASPGV